MAKTRRLGLAALLLTFIAGAMWLMFGQTEPMVEGKRLSAWLRDFAPGQPLLGYWRNDLWERPNAPRIGTNAIPYLLRMVQARDLPFKQSFAAFFRRRHIYIKTADGYHRMAEIGFAYLGPTGESAVPQLIRLLDSPDPAVRQTAAWCLGDIGPGAQAAIPSLIRLLDATNGYGTVLSPGSPAAVNLGRIHAEPQVVVPALIAKLNPSNAIFVDALYALADFGTNAAPAAPVLRQIIMADTNRYYMRLQVADILQNIAPEPPAPAATNR